MTTEAVCSICSKVVEFSELGTFDDTVLELLDIIFSRDEIQALKNVNDLKMCKICIEKVHEIFNFKSNCVYVEDVLTPYIETSNCNLDLKAIGWKENLFNEYKLPNIDAVCRLCLHPIFTEKNLLQNAIKQQNGLQQIFEKNLTEVNLKLVKESYLCEKCLINLEKYWDLIKGCSQSHESLEEPTELLEDKRLVIKEYHIKEDDENEVFDNSETKLLQKCPECTYVTNSYRCLVRHAFSHKKIKEEDLFKCDKCPFKSKYRRSWQNHKKTLHSPTGTMTTCPHCSKELKKCSLGRHLKMVHSSEGEKFFCNVCEYSTRNKQALVGHRLIHTSDCQWFHCTKCSYKSKFNNKLKRHLLLHDNKPPKHECKVCDYKTNYKENLKKHMRKHDGNTEMFSCDQCTYVTKHKEYMKYHKAIHAESGEVQSYKCSICSYETIHRGNLIKQHMKTHKPQDQSTYRCDKCDFKTYYKQHIINHEKVHKDFKEVDSFYCHLCTFKTKHKSSMLKHVKTHPRNN